MTTQTLKIACTIFMIVAICTVMLSIQNYPSARVEKCVKHYIPNQCMKVAKKADLTICEEACIRFCNKQVPNHE